MSAKPAPIVNHKPSQGRLFARIAIPSPNQAPCPHPLLRAPRMPQIRPSEPITRHPPIAATAPPQYEFSQYPEPNSSPVRIAPKRAQPLDSQPLQAQYVSEHMIPKLKKTPQKGWPNRTCPTARLRPGAGGYMDM